MLPCAAVLLGFFSIMSVALASESPDEILARFRSENAGVTYRFGACSRTQMDCSCLVQRLFRRHFDLSLPRDTLRQERSMKYLRARHLRRPDHLNPEDLCVGDLIYTYQGARWETGRRHVVVYAGNGRVLHAAASLGGIGESPLSWVRQFHLRGVYRPLGC